MRVEYYTVEQVAELTHKSIRALREMRHRRRGPRPTYVGRAADFASHIAAGPGIDPKQAVDKFIDTDTTRFSWNRADKANVARGRHYEVDRTREYVGTYRPFTKEHVHFQAELNDMVYRMPTMFPTSKHRNLGIYNVGHGSAVPFSVIATDLLPDLHVTGAGSGGQFFARYTYEPVEEGTFDLAEDTIDGYRRVDNITDSALKQNRAWYGEHVTKDGVLAFVYGFLHSADYRDRYAADLKRSLPRIPRIEAADFAAFLDAGRQLLDLHINYEDVDPFSLNIDGLPEGLEGDALYDALRVVKMSYGKIGKDKDPTVIRYSNTITVSGIPEEAQRYMLGSRSALDWIIERYQVKTDKPSGIVNDPNDWSREVGNPRYILDLIAKVTTVSVETMKIVDALPPLRIVESDA